MGGVVVSRLLIMGGGLLYPAYSSYKAVKAAKLRSYVSQIKNDLLNISSVHSIFRNVKQLYYKTSST